MEEAQQIRDLGLPIGVLQSEIRDSRAQELPMSRDRIIPEACPRPLAEWPRS